MIDRNWEFDFKCFPDGCVDVDVLWLDSGVIMEMCSCDYYWLCDGEKPDCWRYRGE